MILGHSISAVAHRHHLVEIYLGLNRDVKIDVGHGWMACRTLLIGSNVPHRFDSQNDWYVLLLVDPEAKIAKQLQENYLNNEQAVILDIEPIEPYLTELQHYTWKAQECGKARKLFDKIFTAYAGGQESSYEVDTRIKEVYKILRDLPEKKTSVKQLARMVHLSESRLTHLFKEQTGTPISRYILWMRLMEAVKCVFNGNDLTTAAHNAGFADSAHLSRTYKQIFGLKPSDFFKPNKDSGNTHVITCPEA